MPAMSSFPLVRAAKAGERRRRWGAAAVHGGKGVPLEKVTAAAALPGRDTAAAAAFCCRQSIS